MAECKICFEDGVNEPLMNPCRCNGSSRWVHESCLQRWRLTNQNTNAYHRCEICLYEYVIDRGSSEEKFHFICIEKYQNSLIELVLSFVFTFLFGNIIWLIDMSNNSYSIYLFNLNNTLKIPYEDNNDLWFAWMYYQSLASFCLNLIIFFIFQLILCFKINNKTKYFKLSLGKNILYLIYCMNFLLITGLTGSYKNQSLMEFWGPLFSSLIFSVYVSYIKNHNKILLKINRELTDDRIIPYRTIPVEAGNIDLNNEIINPLNIVSVDEVDVSN